MRGWCGVPQGGRLLKQMRMRILWESSLCPPPTPAHTCSASMHIDGQTDTSVRTHTDFWPIRRRERAQESQPDPCQPSPAAFSGCDFPVLLSPFFFFFSAPSLAALSVSLTLPACYAGFLLTLSLCPSVSQSPFHSHCVSLLIFLSFSYFTGLSIYPVSALLGPAIPLPQCHPRDLWPRGTVGFQGGMGKRKRL